NFSELGKVIFGLGSGPIPFFIDKLNEAISKANEILKGTSFQDIAEAGLKNFFDRLKQVNDLIKEGKEEGRQLGNIFAQDVVNAINEVNAEIKLQEDFIGSIATINGKNTKIYKDQVNQLEILKAELDLLKTIQTDLFKALTDYGNGLDSLTPLLTRLQNELNNLKKAQESAFTEEGVIRYGKQIDILSGKISKLRAGISLTPPPVENLDPFSGLNLTPQPTTLTGETLLPFQLEVLQLLNTEYLETADSIDIFNQRLQEQQSIWDET